MKIESFDKEKSVVITTMGQKLVRELQSTTQEETIEKIAENESEYLADWEDKDMYKRGFVDGAKWMVKRTYSEDEVRELLMKGLTHTDYNLCGSLVTAQQEIRTANFNVWFEEYKKK